MEAVEKEFEDFFHDCRKQGFTSAQMRTICQPLIWQQQTKRVTRLVGITLLALAFYCCWCWFDSFSWSISAIGRLMLIELLPYWNWTPLYNAKCFIERTMDVDHARPVAKLGRYETDADNCVLCESLERIPTTSNVTFSFLDAVFLERGWPVIVTDSHAPQTLGALLDTLFSTGPDWLESSPCDVSTNLMLKQVFNLELALQKIKLSHPTDKWLQLRNCQPRAVKASRLFVKRPYYYPLHMEPFYSSWLLLSHNHSGREHEIYLRGLVFVQQLSGHFDVQLRPKQPCEPICPTINIRLNTSECLVFSTELWTFSYGTTTAEAKATSIATLLEIDWQS